MMHFIVNLLRAIANFIINLLRAFQKNPDPVPEPEPIDPPPVEPNIIVDLIPIERGNRPGYALTPKYITIHDTGNSNAGANAKAHAIYIKGETAARLPVSWHFTVDDMVIYQHLPLNENGWHAGDGNGPGNRASIGIEICENSDGDRSKAELNAAMLIAWLHSQIPSLLPFPSSMKQHFDWSGKNCPHIIRSRPNGWQRFLDLVPLKNQTHMRA